MLKKIVILSIFFIYVVSLFLPALNTFGIYGDNNNKMSLGYELLIYGAAALFFGIPAWLANLTFLGNSILCLISSKHKRRKIILGVTTVLLSISIFIPPAGFKLLNIGVGYYLWTTSFLLLLLYNYFEDKV